MTNEKKKEILEEGWHDFRLVWIVDLGTKEDNYQGIIKHKRSFLFGFEFTDALMEGGEKPFLLSKRYTISESSYGSGLRINEMSKGYKELLANWRPDMCKYTKKDDTSGKKEKKKNVDIKDVWPLIGQTGKALISHVYSEYKGDNYAVIDKFGPEPKNKKMKESYNKPTTYFIADNPPAEGLPKWVIKEISESREKMGLPIMSTTKKKEEKPKEVTTPETGSFTDDIPF